MRIKHGAALVAALAIAAFLSACAAAGGPAHRRLAPLCAADSRTYGMYSPGGACRVRRAAEGEAAAPDGAWEKREYLRCDFYDSDTVRLHFSGARAYAAGELAAVCVPHYAPVMDMTASALLTAGDGFDTVIVVGPDHAGKGGGVTLASLGWDTGAGRLECDADTADAILADKGIDARRDDDLLRLDHSVSIQMPYVRHCAPDSKVVAILLGKGTPQSKLDALSALIGDISLQKRVLLVASADFSHYQTADETARRDEVTKDIIARRDLTALLRLGHENIDSPESVYVMLKLAEYIGGDVMLMDSRVTYYAENSEYRAGSFFVYGAQRGE